MLIAGQCVAVACAQLLDMLLQQQHQFQRADGKLNRQMAAAAATAAAADAAARSSRQLGNQSTSLNEEDSPSKPVSKGLDPNSQ